MKKARWLLAIGVCMSTTIPAHAAKQTWQQQSHNLSDDYFDQVYFHYAPSSATAASFHQYDGQLEDDSRQNIDTEIAQLKVFLSTLDKIKQERSSVELEFMKLRADGMKKQGAAFSLEKFHDDFLRQGFPPIRMVREAMLGDNSPVL